MYLAADTNKGELLFPSDPGRGLYFAELKGEGVDLNAAEKCYERCLRGKNTKPHELAPAFRLFPEMRADTGMTELEALMGLGSLGDGFIEVARDNLSKRFYLMVCAGSGKIGRIIRERYSSIREFTWDAYRDYVNDLRVATAYARFNRNVIASQLIAAMGTGISYSRHVLYSGLWKNVIQNGAAYTDNGFVVFCGETPLVCCPERGAERKFIPWQSSAPVNQAVAALRGDGIKVHKTLAPYKVIKGAKHDSDR